MTTPAPRAALGCGGAVGLGAAIALIITVIAIGRAVLGQVEGAVRVVIVFAEIAVCVLLGAAALGILGALVFGAQLARVHVAERRAALPAIAVRAEVLEDRGTLPSVPRAIDQAPGHENFPPAPADRQEVPAWRS